MASKNSGSKTQGSALAPLKSYFHGRSPKVARKHKKVAEDGSTNTCLEFDLPPCPAEFGAKEFAVSLLRAGAEIEHSLAVQYLYAAYSIDETSHAPRNLTSLEWKTHLRLVAREEMALLVTVQNLLLALGQEPHLNRGPMHRAESELPLPFKLEPLNQKSAGKYVLIESPTDDQINDADKIVMKEIKLLLGKHGSRVLRVGKIYAALYWLFLENNDPDPDWPFPDECVETFKKRYPRSVHLRDKDFIPLGEYQDRAADPREWGVFESSTHVDGASPRETALASLRWIMSQGEGPNAIEESHFCRFLKIYKEFAEDSHSADMVMNVPVNPRIKGVKGSRGAGRETGTLITNRRTKQWGALFNLRYQLMLLNVVDSLAESRKTMAEKRRLFARWSSVEMEFMKKIGQALPRLDLRNRKDKDLFNDKHKGPGAGAPFQSVFLPDPSVKSVPLRRQLLLASGDCISALRDPSPMHPTDTDYGPAAAIEPSLLDTIPRQDEQMRS